MLIDNDRISRNSVRTHLADSRDFEAIGEATTAEQATAGIKLRQPDVIFADFGLLQEAGSFLASGYSDRHRPIVVFLATHQHLALQAFDLGAADFLLRPIRQDRFEVCLARIRSHLESRRTVEKLGSENLSPKSMSLTYGESQVRITITNRRRTHVIDTDEIDWIAAAGDYSEIHVARTTHLLREPLSVLLNRLPATTFCRIHRSFAVNLNRVSGFKALRNHDFLVRMKDRSILRASRTFSDDFRTAIALQGPRRHAALGLLPRLNDNGVSHALYA